MIASFPTKGQRLSPNTPPSSPKNLDAMMYSWKIGESVLKSHSPNHHIQEQKMDSKQMTDTTRVLCQPACIESF